MGKSKKSKKSSKKSKKQDPSEDAHHAEGRVDPEVNEGKNGFWFWIPQSN
jgi:hypothetical protein